MMYILLYEHIFMQNVAVIIVFVVVRTYIHTYGIHIDLRCALESAGGIGALERAEH